VTTSDPARQEDAAGTAIQLQVTSPNVADGQSAQFAASDLPPGLSISSSGLIAGTISPTASGTYQVTVTSTSPSGATGSVSFLWTVASGQPSPPLAQASSPSPFLTPSSDHASPSPSGSASPSLSDHASTSPTPSLSDSPSPAVSPSDSASPTAGAGTTPLSDSGLIGFSAPELLDDDSGVQLQQLQQMKSMGMSTVRVDADWSGGEPSPDSFDWSTLDRIMASIQTVGMTADLIIDGCPAWAAAPGAAGEFAQPAEPSQFAAWAAAVAARYSAQGTRYFEIWNEPNIQEFWSPTPNPAAYTQDLVAAYAAIKEVDPAAVVISGGLSDGGNTSTTYDPVTFLEDMYADGAKGSFDEVGDHPYSFPSATPDSGMSSWTEMDGTSPSLRSVMAANGDSAKKIWITEYGAPTIGENAVSESAQTTDLTEAISQMKQTSWIGAFYIYTWSDQYGGAGFGLLDSNGDPKPAYSAIAALTRA